ncbi:MAG: hypothetical protein AAFQ15_11210 [Pseudomonadota bacterium]
MAGGTGPVIWRFFADDNGQEGEFLAIGAGDREGQYFPGFGMPFQGTRGFADGVDQNADLSDQFKKAVFVDTLTTTFVVLDGAPEAKIISPLTQLLISGLSQEKLKRQLGVTENVFRLRSIDPDLNTFDPLAELDNDDDEVVADAQRLLAANLRALALARGTGTSCIDNFVLPDPAQLGEALKSAPDQFLFNDNSAMTDVVSQMDELRDLDPEVHSAIAHLINAYAAAVALRIDRSEFAARFLMGIDGFLVPRIREVCTANTSAAASVALAISSQDIIEAVERFNEVISATTDGLLFPAPDYYETTADTPLTLVDQSDLGIANEYPSTNDRYTASPTQAGFLGAGIQGIGALEVPATNAGEISATIDEDGTITLVPATGFTGLTYVDYTISHESGETGRGRIFIRVMPTS